jgi:hypothetical protein
MLGTITSTFSAVYRLYNRQGSSENLSQTHGKIMGISGALFAGSLLLFSRGLSDYWKYVPITEWPVSATSAAVFIISNFAIFSWTALMKDLPEAILPNHFIAPMSPPDTVSSPMRAG